MTDREFPARRPAAVPGSLVIQTLVVQPLERSDPPEFHVGRISRTQFRNEFFRQGRDIL
jgi:hypothetical protein